MGNWINGDAQIAGRSSYCRSFLYAWPTGAFSTSPVALTLAINDNDQITGNEGSNPNTNSVFEHEGNYSYLAVPGASPEQVESLSDFMLDPNTHSQAKVALVGMYSDGTTEHAFVATSQ